jgi:hypothetical protein
VVIETNFPENSILINSKFDYKDCFQGVLVNEDVLITPAHICMAFLASVREVMQNIFNIKSKTFSFLGLTTAKKINTPLDLNSFKYETGEQLGLLNVFYRDSSEVVLSATVKQLDFKISLLLANAASKGQKKLALSTLIVFHGWRGRLLFLLIKPLHKFMGKRLLELSIKRLETMVIISL